MRRVECFGWILMGFVLGTATTTGIATAGQFRKDPPTRMVLTNAGYHDSRGFQFVRDSKTGGCWLLVRSNETGTPNPIALAEAPLQACQEDPEAPGR
jgi:hypothetical protein